MVAGQNLEIVTDIQILQEIKENIKRDILDPNLNWQERMDLYRSVKNINKRIEKLTNRCTD